MDYSLDNIKIDRNLPQKFLQSKLLLYFVVFLIVIKIMSAAIFINLPQNIFFADVTKGALIKLVNQQRETLGILPLAENKKLDEAASLKARDMIDNDYFSHQSPSGVTPWYWFKTTGYNYKYAGENLAIGFFDSIEVYRAWYNSPSHKNNLLNSNYKEMGIAVTTGNFQGNNTTVVVQLFGAPQVAAVKVQEKPVVLEGTALEEKTVESADNQTEKEVLSQSTEYLSTEENNLGENSLYFKIMNFIVYKSEKNTERILYITIILISISLLSIIFTGSIFQNKGLVLRSIILVAVLLMAGALNIETISQIIPHQIVI